MDSLALDNLSNFSWDKEGFQDEISFERQNVAPKKQVSCLKNSRFYSTKIYNIFLLVTLKPASKNFHQISIKLPLQITIQEAMHEIFSQFEILLKKQNALFSIVEDTNIWQIRVAKKTGQPKDYIPAIDQLNLMKSVECYDNLVLCPIKQSECIQISSSTTISSTTTKPNSNASNSPQSFAQYNYCNSLVSECNEQSNFSSRIEENVSPIHKDSKIAQKSQITCFDKDSNSSTVTSIRGNKKTLKSNISHYNNGFQVKEEEDDMETLSSQRYNRISEQNKKEISNIQIKKKKGFFSFLCC